MVYTWIRFIVSCIFLVYLGCALSTFYKIDFLIKNRYMECPKIVIWKCSAYSNCNVPLHKEYRTACINENMLIVFTVCGLCKVELPIFFISIMGKLFIRCLPLLINLWSLVSNSSNTMKCKINFKSNATLRTHLLQ